tara:strand:- start:25357 stop:26181 length:825 start_codon:yes stop_codon:yes gene_type:complete
MFKNLSITLTIFLLFSSISCTTIEITESDAFDAHRTITPATFDVNAFNFQQHTIETEDGESLDAWFLQRDDAVATVLYLGGNGFLMVKSRPLIQAYATLPVNLLLIDYRGYGLSSGDPTVRGVQEDARSAFRFITSDAVPQTDKIFVHGHSMGTFLAAILTEENSVDGYILESPATEVERWTKRLIPWIMRPFVRFEIDEDVKAQSNSDKVASITTPLLIMGGTADDVTPIRMAEELYEKSASNQKKLVKISGGGHNNLPNTSLYRQSLREFIR